MAGDIFEIDKSVAESILVDKTKIQTLSYPARRVLYAGRASGRWFTKSEATYDEIMALYKKTRSASTRPKKNNTVPTSEPREVIKRLDELLKILTSYGK